MNTFTADPTWPSYSLLPHLLTFSTYHNLGFIHIDSHACYGNAVLNLSCELLAVDQTSKVNKVKTLEQSLKFLLDCQQPLASLAVQLTSDATEDVTLQDETVKLASIIQSRLQSTLLNLIKNLSATSKNRSVEMHSHVIYFYSI